MWDVAVDLLLGGACAGCGRPGRALCGLCEAALPARGRWAWPDPTPRGLAPPMAAGEYAGVLQALVNAHKERQVFALAGPLGGLLAGVLVSLLDEAAAGPGPLGRVALVPVPSRRARVRGRGHDPLLRTARRAASRLRRTGVDAVVVRALAPARRIRDQASLGAEQREQNLAGAFRCTRPPAPERRLAVVVDDVITTGATAREAQRALEAAGHIVLGVAAVAATRRRGRTDSDPSLPLSNPGD